MKFRLVREEDAAALLKIYRPYVEKTAITFEYDVPSLEDFQFRIRKTSAVFPYLLATDDEGEILGYAYASRYRERKAYDWVVELSIYLDETKRGQKVGSALYRRLLDSLSALNYQRAYACITHPNDGSHAFHEKFGFKEIGIMEKSGYKFEQWWGIEWMDLALQDSDEVKELRLITDLSEQELAAILA